MTETEENTKKWKYAWTGGINIVKMSTVLKAIYRLNTIPIKISIFSTEMKKRPLRKTKIRNSQNILSRKNKAGGIIIPVFKINHKAIEIKIAWYWHRNKPMCFSMKHSVKPRYKPTHL